MSVSRKKYRVSSEAEKQISKSISIQNYLEKAKDAINFANGSDTFSVKIKYLMTAAKYFIKYYKVTATVKDVNQQSLIDADMKLVAILNLLTELPIGNFNSEFYDSKKLENIFFEIQEAYYRIRDLVNEKKVKLKPYPKKIVIEQLKEMLIQIRGNDDLILSIRRMLSFAYRSKGDFNCKGLSDNNNNSFANDDNYEEAIIYYKEAVVHLKEILKTPNINDLYNQIEYLVQVYYNLSVCCLEIRECDSAKSYLEERNKLIETYSNFLAPNIKLTLALENSVLEKEIAAQGENATSYPENSNLTSAIPAQPGEEEVELPENIHTSIKSGKQEIEDPVQSMQEEIEHEIMDNYIDIENEDLISDTTMLDTERPQNSNIVDEVLSDLYALIDDEATQKEKIENLPPVKRVVRLTNHLTNQNLKMIQQIVETDNSKNNQNNLKFELINCTSEEDNTKLRLAKENLRHLSSKIFAKNYQIIIDILKTLKDIYILCQDLISSDSIHAIQHKQNAYFVANLIAAICTHVCKLKRSEGEVKVIEFISIEKDILEINKRKVETEKANYLAIVFKGIQGDLPSDRLLEDFEQKDKYRTFLFRYFKGKTTNPNVTFDNPFLRHNHIVARIFNEVLNVEQFQSYMDAFINFINLDPAVSQASMLVTKKANNELIGISSLTEQAVLMPSFFQEKQNKKQRADNYSEKNIAREEDYQTYLDKRKNIIATHNKTVGNCKEAMHHEERKEELKKLNTILQKNLRTLEQKYQYARGSILNTNLFYSPIDENNLPKVQVQLNPEKNRNKYILTSSMDDPDRQALEKIVGETKRLKAVAEMTTTTTTTTTRTYFSAKI